MPLSARLPQTGDVFAGKYLVESVLGEGGFGLVLRAREANSNRPVALKILKPSGEGYDLTTATRFLREMRAIAQLQCPYTLTLYDYGKTDGLLYMATEFVGGEDLSQLLRRRRKLPEREVVHVLYQVLQSLSEAHQHGILHRDIKPANIRVFEYEHDALMVKVLDFGLAQSLDGSQSKLTATGRIIGTPRYMAPERIGDDPLTPATDIFSLGVVAIEALLGEASIVRQWGEPIIIGDDANVTGRLRSIVHRMVAVEPRDRYQQASEILRDLRDVRPSVALPAPVVVPVAPVATDAPALPPMAAPTSDESSQSPPERPTQTRNLVLGLLGALVFVAAATALVLRSQPQEPARIRPVPVATDRVAAPFVRDEPEIKAIPIVAADAGSDVLSGCGLEEFETGLKVERWFDGVTPRPWGRVVPDSYDGSPHPVLLLVTDLTAEVDVSVQHLELRRTARELGVIVVVVPTPKTGSLRIASEILDRVASTHCIDRDHVLAMGQAEMEGVVRDLTCEGLATARMYRVLKPYGRNDICWDGRVVPTLAFVGFKMDTESAPMEQYALDAHDCSDKPRISDDVPRMRCHAATCETPLIVCRQSGHIHYERVLGLKYRHALFGAAL